MLLTTVPFLDQKSRLPKSGKVILAQYDSDSVIVYQAYRPSIGHFAAKYGRFGGEFSMSRMTWIKPNFLWMMYRSGWGSKEDQEVTLAIRVTREGFDEILRQAVHSTFKSQVYASRAAWETALATSNVRLQWDPDRGPSGGPLERRAIQLGLRRQALDQFVDEWVLGIEDISEFVEQQREFVLQRKLDQLVVPSESIYEVRDAIIAARLELDSRGSAGELEEAKE